jgi:predicted DNA-binding ribbon-helix-helix protein
MNKALRMPSLIRKRSIYIGGHKTSLGLEQEFWDGLREIAVEQGKSLSATVVDIDYDRILARRGNLSSAVRLFVLHYYRSNARTQEAPRVSTSKPLRAQMRNR